MEYKSKMLTESEHWEENLTKPLCADGTSISLWTKCYPLFYTFYCASLSRKRNCDATANVGYGGHWRREIFSNVWQVGGSLEVTTATIQVEGAPAFHYAEWYAEWSPLFTYKWSRELCSYHMWSSAIILPITPWLWRNRCRWNCSLLKIKNDIFVPESNSHGGHLQTMNLNFERIIDSPHILNHFLDINMNLTWPLRVNWSVRIDYRSLMVSSILHYSGFSVHLLSLVTDRLYFR